MRPPRDKNDRVILGMVSVLAGLGLVVAVSSIDITPLSPRLLGTGASAAEQTVPAVYHMLVDHALVRVERGLAGVLEVSGPDHPDVFKDHDPAKSAQSMSH